MYLWEIYIFPGLVYLFCCKIYVDQSWEYINRSQKHECGNWDWGRAIPRKRIHKWDFLQCVILTINVIVPVAYMVRYVMILRLAIPGNRDCFGPWNSDEHSECHLGPKKCVPFKQVQAFVCVSLCPIYCEHNCILGVVTALPPLSSGRYGHACTLQGNNLIVSGGYTSKYISLVEQLDLK
jgi:hypothetical protein